MKIRTLFFLALSTGFISSCTGSYVGSPTSSGSSYEVKPSSTPSGSASGSSLNIGLLPDNTNSPEEVKINSILNKQVNVVFPLKAGVLLYNDSTNISDKTRKELYNTFVNSLKSNPNIQFVQDIPSSLLTGNKNIEDIRKLAARFQISTLFIIDDKYKPTQEDTTSETTPIDVVRGVKNWVSQTNINVLAFDIPSGVFIATGSANSSSNDKYESETNNSKNKSDLLDKDSATKSWTLLNDKVNQQIDDFKSRFAHIVPVASPSNSPTPVSSPSASTSN